MDGLEHAFGQLTAVKAREVRDAHAARRTLYRHLDAEGLSFTVLLDEVRRELALRHLRDSNMPAAEIAQLLGFSAPSGFSHWFRAHFGFSVTQWRKQATG